MQWIRCRLRPIFRRSSRGWTATRSDAAEMQSRLSSVVSEEQQTILGADALTLLRAETLAQLIDRRLVEAALTKSIGEVSAKDVDAAVENLKLQLEGQQKTLESVLAERRRPPAALKTN